MKCFRPAAIALFAAALSLAGSASATDSVRIESTLPSAAQLRDHAVGRASVQAARRAARGRWHSAARHATFGASIHASDAAASSRVTAISSDPRYSHSNASYRHSESADAHHDAAAYLSNRLAAAQSDGSPEAHVAALRDGVDAHHAAEQAHRAAAGAHHAVDPQHGGSEARTLTETAHGKTHAAVAAMGQIEATRPAKNPDPSHTARPDPR